MIKKITLSLLLLTTIYSAFSQVTVSGRQILVNGSPYQIKGVCYSPHAIGSPEWTPDFSKVSQDIQLMKAACVNTIRTYRPITDKTVLDAFANAGIKIITGFTLDDTKNGAYSTYINTYKTHPAILMWVFGNEFNYHPDWFNNNLANWYSILNSAAGNARSLDPSHPVATVHGELPDATAINSCPNVQVWGMNIYRVDNPGSLYSDWAARSGKPMFIAESGGDAYPDPNAPATALPKIYNTVKSNTSICSGICFFEWVDEWWKCGNNGVQDACGFSNGGVPYDGFANEEYWGLVDIYRNVRPGYNALKTAYCTSTPTYGTFYKDCNYGGYAKSLPVGDYTLAQMNAQGILNDDISSLQLSSGYEVQLFENDNFGGASIVINSNNSCLVGNGWNDRASSLKLRKSASTTYSITIQAENYSNMFGVQTESTSDAGGGLDVGWIDANDWMAYNTINFPTSGSYLIEYRVASPSGGKLSSDLNAGSIQLGAVSIPATGGYQNWTTVSLTVNVNAGTYNFGVFAQTGGWNFNWVRITKSGTAKMTSSPSDDFITSDYSVTSLQLYPNPAGNIINLNSSYDLTGADVKFIDAIGVEVYKGEVVDHVDVSNLKAGIYTVIVNTVDGHKLTSRFAKQ
jgi:hypothetical protein